jgi:hypothetical protein
MSWTIGARQVTASNGKVVNFDYDIAETAEVAGTLVVVLDVPPGRVMTENVFGVSSEGKLMWQIERTAVNANPTNVYTGITRHDQHIAHIYNWNANDTVVDVRTGKILDTGIAK